MSYWRLKYAALCAVSNSNLGSYVMDMILPDCSGFKIWLKILCLRKKH